MWGLVTETAGVTAQDGSGEAASPKPQIPVSMVVEHENVGEDLPEETQGNEVYELIVLGSGKSGLVDLGGRWLTVLVFLAGNAAGRDDRCHS